VLEDDPGFVLGHLLRAEILALSTERAAQGALGKSVEAAEALAASANERERGHLKAVRAWLDGDYQGTADLLGRVLVDHPRDLLALQIAHIDDFFVGDAGNLRDRVARVLPEWDEGVPGYGFVLGCHAFGLEEMGDYAAAERAARRALALNPKDCWAVHAGAHVFEMQARHDEGIAWLEGRQPDWAPGNFFAIHNWWHLALYYLDLGATAKVLALYDGPIRAGRSKVALDMLDAAALLWRLHLLDVPLGARWEELAELYAPQAEDAYYAFNDMHAMMCFAATGRTAEANALLAAQERLAREGGGTNAMMTREVGLPVCRALLAFGLGDYASAVELLLPVRYRANRFGGSHAQRDVLPQTLIVAALKGGQFRLARALANERMTWKPSSPGGAGFRSRADAGLRSAPAAVVQKHRYPRMTPWRGAAHGGRRHGANQEGEDTAMLEDTGDPSILDELLKVIENCRRDDPERSYTAKLFGRGHAHIAKKFGEEAVETVIAAMERKKPDVIDESADVLYHLLVLWASCGVKPAEVYAELARRKGTSGLVEKRRRAQ
jgi:phosphoribosyl-ATP pyrophosphohydrolase